jgi:eight-cysteine-cluster-containing protein
MRISIVVIGLLVGAGCGAASSAVAPVEPIHDERTCAVAFGEKTFKLVEAPELNNQCSSDAECFVGGCASYICSAQQGVQTDCDDAPALAPFNSSCGCVNGLCSWWRPRGYAGPGTRGQPCAESQCVGGLTCFGHAPDDRCEIYCRDASGGDPVPCPGGEACVDFQCQRG